MEKTIKWLILTCVFSLFANHAMAMELTAGNIPWLFFVYGIPVAAVLCIAGVFIWHLMSKGS